MPSHLHEALLLLFRNRSALAPELIRHALHAALPEYSEARIESANLTDIQPAEYRADLVVMLLREKSVFGIVEDPELAGLSAMAHGQDTDTSKAARIAWSAQLASLGLDADRASLRGVTSAKVGRRAVRRSCSSSWRYALVHCRMRWRHGFAAPGSKSWTASLPAC